MSPKEGRGLGARQDQQPELWHRCTLVMSFQKHWVKPRKRRYYEVYDRVSALFDRQIEEYGKERFTQRLAEFRALKAAVPPPPSPPPPKARPPPPVDTSIPPPPIASLPPPNATAAATAAAAADNATLPARRRALLKTVTVPKPHSRLQVKKIWEDTPCTNTPTGRVRSRLALANSARVLVCSGCARCMGDVQFLAVRGVAKSQQGSALHALIAP